MSHVNPKPKQLDVRIQAALALYPADLLFIHRDAESADAITRRQEIAKALDTSTVRYIPVVPARMTEAWFLHDQAAIRGAAGDPNGQQDLSLPPPHRVESLVNPKHVLTQAIQEASGRHGRRLRLLDREMGSLRILVAERVDDFTPIVDVPSFAAFLQDVRSAIEVLREQGIIP